MEFSKDNGSLYDVVAVSIDTNKILWVDRKKTFPFGGSEGESGQRRQFPVECVARL